MLSSLITPKVTLYSVYMFETYLDQTVLAGNLAYLLGTQPSNRYADPGSQRMGTSQVLYLDWKAGGEEMQRLQKEGIGPDLKPGPESELKLVLLSGRTMIKSSSSFF